MNAIYWLAWNVMVPMLIGMAIGYAAPYLILMV